MTPNIQFNRSAIRAVDCISEGMAIIQPNYFLFLGITFLAFILTACIPCLNFFIVGPILAGVYYTIFRQMRNEPVEFGMMFKGFEKFVPAMVIGLIISIPEIIGSIIRVVANVADGFTRGMNRGRGNSDFFAQSMQSFPEIALGGGMIAIILILVLAGLLFSIAWGITFTFALPLISEHDLSIGEAVSLSAKAGWSNIGGLIVLFILQFLVALAGTLLFCVGVFFVLPIIYGSKAVAYRQVFPDTYTPLSNEPPKPDAYGVNYGMPQAF